MIKSFHQFVSAINETKLFIYQRKFRVDDLINANIYEDKDIATWMMIYDFDNLAHCMFVTLDPVKGKSNFDLRVSSRDIKNKTFFNDTGKYEGYLIKKSKKKIDGDVVYLFVFKKNSNINLRARQIHGFKYEAEVRRLSNLTKLSYTDKWDAHGTLDKRYFDNRVDSGKKIEYFDGKKYNSLLRENTVNGADEIDWESIPASYKANLSWSIKSISNGKSVEMGDFKRISGLEKDGDKLKFRSDGTENFMFQVSFHDGSSDRNVIIEYLTLMPISVWKKYLPDMTNLTPFENMYKEIKAHYLKGERTELSETEWLKFQTKYSKLTQGSIIKLRFKRDSEGQLRIQSAINYGDFINNILKNPHIRIS